MNGSFAIFPQVQPVKLAREGKIPAVRLRKVVEIPRYPLAITRHKLRSVKIGISARSAVTSEDF